MTTARATIDPPQPANVCVVLLDSLNRHMLGTYGGTEFATPNLDRFAREHATRFTGHVTGSLPCMPARHDILVGALDFLWKPWGSIELWEQPITRVLAASGVRSRDAVRRAAPSPWRGTPSGVRGPRRR
jgi:arylsulfatase A-like enzyme